MNIAQAMKKKNRMLREIGKVQSLIQSYNSVYIESGRPQGIDVEDLMKKYKDLKSELISLKLKIFEASRPMREHIIRLSEIKDYLTFLGTISTDSGKTKESTYHDVKFVEKDCILDHEFIQGEKKKLEEEIDSIQDELDAFNHRTEID